MMDVFEVKRWLETLAPGSSIGIDEGGLTLREVTAQNEMTEAYCEVGGIPEEIENP
jgi:hypothetical protein